MKTEKMWTELAEYYDLIYSWKDYRKESIFIHRLIQKQKKIPGNELLDVACGTGNHIQHLKRHYRITGLDKSREMLRIARKKLPGVRFVQGDMMSFDLKRRFDVITCLFGSIGYVKTYTNLRKTISTFSKHLKPGGILIVEPFYNKDSFVSGVPHAVFVNEENVKIARMNISVRHGSIGVLDFHFLIATRKGVKHLRDRHELGLFNTDRFLRIMKRMKLKAKYTKGGIMKERGLYIGIKPL